MQLGSAQTQKMANMLDAFIILMSVVILLSWLLGEGLFYSPSSPVVSPFTALTLILMSGSRLAERSIETFAKPMALALIGIAIGGNISSIMVQTLIPELFIVTMPSIVATSIMTSVGLILFGCYEMLVIFRKTPKTAFIIDDILLHLALIPGGISLLGHWFDNPYYIASTLDPRSGISLLEMLLMGSFATASAFANPNLFLWKFLTGNHANKIIFGLFFLNQYIAPVIVTYLLGAQRQPQAFGIELFVMLGGVFTTLTFLIVQAVQQNTGCD